MSLKEKPEKIANRESWLKVILIGVFSIIVIWKLLITPININFAEFRFIDLLSLILAMFAMVLSVAFYFKASDTSNEFYDNTYKFTKEVSEILGRIEAGFGERLRHLDEGYAGLRDRFDKIPIDPIKAEKQVKQEEEEVKKKEQERNQLIESLAQKARLQENEKKEIFSKLKEKDEELHNAKRELLFLQRRLSRADVANERQSEGIGHIESEAIRYIRRRLLPELGMENVIDVPRGIVKRRFENIKGDLPDGFLMDLGKLGLIDTNGLLTDKGVAVIRDLAKTV